VTRVNAEADAAPDVLRVSIDAKATVKMGPFARGGKGRVAVTAADHVTTLVLNLDNGPESHSHRTQFMARLVAFVQRERVSVRLAYYPPYHSKYNPIERCWGILEGHWNGALLDSLEAVCGFTASMTWKGLHPVVDLVTTTYATGVKLTTAAMAVVEAQVTRLPALDKWFVDIPYVPGDLRDA